MYLLPVSAKSFQPVAPPPPSADGDNSVWLDAERQRILDAIETASNFLALMEERLGLEFAEIASLDERRAQVERNIAAISDAIDETTAELERIREWSDQIEADYGATS